MGLGTAVLGFALEVVFRLVCSSTLYGFEVTGEFNARCTLGTHREYDARYGNRPTSDKHRPAGYSLVE